MKNDVFVFQSVMKKIPTHTCMCMQHTHVVYTCIYSTRQTLTLNCELPFPEPDTNNPNLNELNDDGTTFQIIVEDSTTNLSMIDTADITVNLCDPIDDLIRELRNSVYGFSILNYYRNNRSLDDTLRVLLCDSIVNTEMRANVDLM